jgi:predicted nuclease of predicted toxin-antitoxin system
MRFLANENFPLPSIKILRDNGYDVLSIYETLRGLSDEDVIKTAREEERIILTFDKDYGELIFKTQRKPPIGVVFFRYKGKYPEDIALKLINIINAKPEIINTPDEANLIYKIELANSYTIIEEKGIRQRHFI